MPDLLIPRLTTEAAKRRFMTLRTEGTSSPTTVMGLPVMHGAAGNPVGGPTATPADVSGWRTELVHRLGQDSATSRGQRDAFGLKLGQAISEVVGPVPGDASHDGAWAFLSLNVVPDLVARRWPLTNDEQEGAAVETRWMGRLAGGRDRNYLRTCWRRWQVLGPVMAQMSTPLGEDEMVGLLERTALARNLRLVRRCAVLISNTDVASRSDFARHFLKHVTYRTGPLLLDVLGDDDLDALLSDAARRGAAEMDRAGRNDSGPRRAM